MDHISTIVEVVVLISTGIIALDKILEICGKPFTKLDARHKRQKEIEKKLTSIESDIKAVKIMNASQNEQIELLQKGQLDMLRQNILYLYDHHKAERAMTESEFEYLEDLYTDYTNEGGNSYIERRYNRMQNWTRLPDDAD